ncbi:MAG: transposase [Pseudomonadota bacterium]
MSHWCREEEVKVWSYCLMPNHVHLIVVPGEGSRLSRAIGEAHRRYARYINFREKWRGYLWQGRFASFPIDEPYLLAAARYVELNPVKAGMVEAAWGYRWSSVHAPLSGRSDGVVKVKPLLVRVDSWMEFIARWR